MEERVWDQTRVFVRVDIRGSTVGMVKDFYLFYPRLTKRVVTTPQFFFSVAQNQSEGDLSHLGGLR